LIRRRAQGDRTLRRNVGRRFFFLVFAALVASLATGCATWQGARRRHPTLERQIVVGYQGWFRAPADGTDSGWAHYRSARTGAFGPDGNIGIDYWPDVSELTPTEKFATPFTHPDGTTAFVFSSHHPRTVERHFRWMREHGIDAAFVQRFAAPIIGDNEPSRRRLRATDDVLRYALAAAEKQGRGLVVMYDLSGLRRGAMEAVMRDWRHVVDDLKVRASRAYQYHHDKPVVIVWGVGFNDGRDYTLDECAALIRYLKEDPRYGGNTVVVGVPSYWREQVNDAVRDPQLHDVLRLADILSPWTPGRYSDLAGVRRHAESFWAPDRTWCTEHGLGYMPVVFPGFSWRNLKGVSGGIDRLDGRFLWEQYRELANRGFTMIYQAMFDEMDEGTQIFKVTSDPPTGAELLSYAPLPSDYYLRLMGVAADRFRRGEPLPERIPDFRGAPEINRYLRSRDDAIYAAAAESSIARARFDALSRLLAAVAVGDWVTPDEHGARLRVRGEWGPRRMASRDPHAVVEWELPSGDESGECSVSIRHLGDTVAEYATAARLRVWQGDTLLTESTINLGEQALHWREISRFRLAAGVPCRIVLDQPVASGTLPLFEPRLLSMPR
jgi:hypothetical protein